MTETQGLVNTTAECGETFTVTSAVPYAGMIVAQTVTAGTVDLAKNTDKPMGFTLKTSVPNKELMEGTDAVAGKDNAIMPIRSGVVAYMPVTATGDITCNDMICVGAVPGYVTARTTENYIIGTAMESVDNSTGASGALFVKVWCAPQYIYTA